MARPIELSSLFWLLDWRRFEIETSLAIALPDLDQLTEADGYKYAIRLNANKVLLGGVAYHLAWPELSFAI